MKEIYSFPTNTASRFFQAVERLPATRYSAWPAWAARTLLLIGLALVIASAIPHERPHLVHMGPANYDDRYFQQELVNRVAAGEKYYSIVAEAQRAHFYPTSPAATIRQPAMTWMLALLPSELGRRIAFLLLLAAATIAMRERLNDTTIPKGWRFPATLLQISGFAIAWYSLHVYQHEIWAALLIAISLGLYRPNRYWSSAFFALLACLIRELALPFIWAMAAFAIWERRWREVAAWTLAMVVFLALYAVHYHIAAGLSHPGDLVSSGWFYGGGWDFVVDTAKLNQVLFFCPPWLVAAAVYCSVLGLAGWRDPWVSRVTLVLGGYLAAFLFVGRPDNGYWGFIYAPLLPLGWVLTPAAFRDLLAGASQKFRALDPTKSDFSVEPKV
jgi:hypothetical protein